MIKKLLSFNRYPEFLNLVWWRVVTPFLVRRAGVTVNEGVEFYGQPIISLTPASRISIGEDATLCSDSRFTDLGINHPVVLRTLRPNATISIGNDTGLSGSSICAAISVTIGSNCLFGANVTVTDTDFHAMRAANRRHNNRHEDIGSAPVYIGDNVFLGTGAIVLKGVTIGENSVIGAGSVVTKNIPANSIAAGNPARVIAALPQ